MPWSELRKVNKERTQKSYLIITYKGMQLSFDISCVWSNDRFKWLLNCESLGIYVNLLGDAGTITKDEVKLKALKLIKDKLNLKIEEVDQHIKGFEQPI